MSEFKPVFVDSYVACSPALEPQHVRDVVREFSTVVSLVHEDEAIFPAAELADSGVQVVVAPVEPAKLHYLLTLLQLVKVVVEAVRRGGKVLVTCLNGRGRSCALVATYLVFKYGLTADEAIRVVRSKRPGAIDSYYQIRVVRRFYYLNSIVGCERFLKLLNLSYWRLKGKLPRVSSVIEYSLDLTDALRTYVNLTKEESTALIATPLLCYLAGSHRGLNAELLEEVLGKRVACIAAEISAEWCALGGKEVPALTSGKDFTKSVARALPVLQLADALASNPAVRFWEVRAEVVPKSTLLVELLVECSTDFQTVNKVVEKVRGASRPILDLLGLKELEVAVID